MAAPTPTGEQPRLAAEGFCIDLNGDCWVLFKDASHWRKVTKEEMHDAMKTMLTDALSRVTPK